MNKALGITMQNSFVIFSPVYVSLDYLTRLAWFVGRRLEFANRLYLCT